MLTDLIAIHPPLKGKWYLRTSLPTPSYNCIAHAANDDTKWWEPDKGGFWYWPPGVQRAYTLRAFTAAYASLGYSVCQDGTVEPGFEKVAIFADGGKPKHAARQLPDGKWSSKIGNADDISHDLDTVSGGGYGVPVRFMKRPTSAPSVAP
jgi:hypothetical protein